MVQKQLGLRDDQVFNNIQRYGNTTAASIPIALHEAVASGRIVPGDLVVFAAFGAGLTWGPVRQCGGSQQSTVDSRQLRRKHSFPQRVKHS